jgi:hypothetical protein
MAAVLLIIGARLQRVQICDDPHITQDKNRLCLVYEKHGATNIRGETSEAGNQKSQSTDDAALAD